MKLQDDAASAYLDAIWHLRNSVGEALGQAIRGTDDLDSTASLARLLTMFLDSADEMESVVLPPQDNVESEGAPIEFNGPTGIYDEYGGEDGEPICSSCGNELTDDDPNLLGGNCWDCHNG